MLAFLAEDMKAAKATNANMTQTTIDLNVSQCGRNNCFEWCANSVNSSYFKRNANYSCRAKCKKC